MFTKKEQGLLEWLLLGERKRCQDWLDREDLAETWKESYQRRLECANSALEKVRYNKSLNAELPTSDLQQKVDVLGEELAKNHQLLTRQSG